METSQGMSTAPGTVQPGSASARHTGVCTADIQNSSPSGDSVLENVVKSGLDAEMGALRGRHGAELSTAFREALAALEPRERTILRLVYIDGLTAAQVGKMVRILNELSLEIATPDEAREMLHTKGVQNVAF